VRIETTLGSSRIVRDEPTRPPATPTAVKYDPNGLYATQEALWEIIRRTEHAVVLFKLTPQEIIDLSPDIAPRFEPAITPATHTELRYLQWIPDDVKFAF